MYFIKFIFKKFIKVLMEVVSYFKIKIVKQSYFSNGLQVPVFFG